MNTQPESSPSGQRRQLLQWLTAVVCTGSLSTARAAGLSAADANAGLRAALERGAKAAVAQLGKPDGFLANPQVHIPLPDTLQRAAKLLRATGQGKRIDELETAMNRAAEAAVPQAQTLLIDAVKSMTVEDAGQILRGSDTAVTEFFAKRTASRWPRSSCPSSAPPPSRCRWPASTTRWRRGPAASVWCRPRTPTCSSFVTGKALDGLFKMIGEEEKKIRQDPVATGQAILQSVFGALKK